MLSLSVARGREAGIRSVAGHAVSSIIPVTAAALGVSSVISASVLAFNTLKLIGALYLIYLGVRQLMSPPPSLAKPKSKGRNEFWQGFITHLTNPKVALFYLSVIPQFINPHLGHVWLQALVLGVIQKLMALIWLSSVAFAGAKAKAWLETHERFVLWQRRLTGALFIGFGLKIALARQKG